MDAERRAAWWAKLRRAEQHRDTPAQLVAEFRASDPYTLTPEATEKPNEVAYRFHIRQGTPAGISTVVGDVLHNLRSALDSLAYDLAIRSTDRDLTEPEQRATEFPICPTPEAYNAFFGNAKRPSLSPAQQVRANIYSERARRAMLVAQPFYWFTFNKSVSNEEQIDRFRSEFEWSPIRALREMHNVDKHRRLNITAWWPDLLWFGSNEGDDTRFRWSGVLADGAILCFLSGPKASETKLQHEFALVLADDPMHRPNDGPYTPRDCLDLLQGFAAEVRRKLSDVLTEYSRG